jgi:hypothetical protein
MCLAIVLTVVLAFVASVGVALFISIDRAASLDHDPAIDLVLGRKKLGAATARTRAARM